MRSGSRAPRRAPHGRHYARGLVAGVGLLAVLTGCGRADGAKDSPPADTTAPDATPNGSASNGAAVAAPTRGASPLRVVFVGTSLTAGLGLDPDSAYPALLQRKADSAGVAVTMVNAGVSGETSAGALRRIDWVLREPLDVLVLETGANDGLRGLQIDSTRANLGAILARTRAAYPSARLVLVQMEAPPNFGGDYTRRFRAMFPAVARRTGATLTPFLLDRVAGVAGLNQPDGIHPNERGERIVAGTVWRALRPVLDSARAASSGVAAGGASSRAASAAGSGGGSAGAP